MKMTIICFLWLNHLRIVFYYWQNVSASSLCFSIVSNLMRICVLYFVCYLSFYCLFFSFRFFFLYFYLILNALLTVLYGLLYIIIKRVLHHKRDIINMARRTRERTSYLGGVLSPTGFNNWNHFHSYWTWYGLSRRTGDIHPILVFYRSISFALFHTVFVCVCCVLLIFLCNLSNVHFTSRTAFDYERESYARQWRHNTWGSYHSVRIFGIVKNLDWNCVWWGKSLEWVTCYVIIYIPNCISWMSKGA